MASSQVKLPEGLTAEQVADELNRREESQMQESKATGAPLQGFVDNFTPEMHKSAANISRNVFPQPGENPLTASLKAATFPLQAMFNGVEAVPEDLTNLAAGAVQQGVGVPQQQRMTFADLMRKLDPGFVSPNEIGQSPEFQQGLQQNPVGNAMWNPSQFMGGFMAPVGAVEAGAMKGAKFIQGAIPGVEMAGKAIQQISQNLPQMQRVLKYTPKVSPTLHGASTGAAYGTAFGAGHQFGDTKALPTAPQAGAMAATGGALGAGTAHGVNMIQKMLFQRELAKLSGQSALPSLPEAPPTQAKDVLPAAPVLKGDLQSVTYKNLARNENGAGPRTDAHKDRVQKRIFDYAAKKAEGESDEHMQAVTEVRRDYNKEQYNRTKVQDRRQYSAGTQAEKRDYSRAQKDDSLAAGMGKRQDDIARKTTHTEQSADHFRNFSDQIDGATSHEDLRAIEDDVFTPGHGPKGDRLLDSSQQRKLERRIHERHRAITAEEERAGESRGTPPSSPAVPQSDEPTPPQNSPASTPPAPASSGAPGRPPADAIEEPKTASAASPALAPPVVPKTETKTETTPKTTGTEAEPAYQPIRTFIQGAFRKVVNVKTYGSRKDRYKFAVSVDALGKAAGLSAEKTAALEKWVAEASAVRRELTYKEQELEKLVEWAYKNESEWVGGKGKVQFDRVENEDGYHQVLTHTEREGQFKTLALRTKMDRHFERKTETQLEHVRTKFEQHGYERAGEEPPTTLKVNPKPTVNTTLNGPIEKGEWQENMDGSLKVFGNVQDLPNKEFVPPKDADELFKRAEALKKRIGHFKSDLQDVYTASGSQNHLGDGTTPGDVMSEAFTNLNLQTNKPGQTPTVHLWHVDKASHVSTVRFDQPKSARKWPDHMKDLEAKYQIMRGKVLDLRGKDGKIDYDAVWKNPSQLLGGFTGLEVVPLVSMFVGKQLHKVFSGIGKNSSVRAVAVGTIDNILKGNARFGGDEISAQFHGMLGEITGAFFHDSAGLLHPTQGAEELSDLLNKFKDAKSVTRSNYRRVARKTAEAEGKTTAAEQAEADKQADTAFMIRQHYNRLAKQVQAKIDEMAIRKQDAKTGEASVEGKKFYTEDDLHHDGKVRKSAYDALYHDALNELHKALTLQPDSAGSLAGLIGDVASRKSTSIMANNPRVALKNLFDQAPMTLAYFHRHFLTAAADMMHTNAATDAIKRLPVVPAADMTVTKMTENLKNASNRAPEDAYQWTALALQKLNTALATKIDPLFGGKSPLVSAPDAMYSRISALASLHKIAARYGIDRHEFVNDLVNKKFGEKEESAIFSEVVGDLQKVYNSVAPHLNKDLFASSALGKAGSQYATPGRRAFRLMYDWAKSDNPQDKMKFVAAFAGFVALGGSGAVPNSLQAIMRLGGAATGANGNVQQTFNNLDDLNMLRQATGVDYSNNFGPDVATGAQPALQALQKMYEKGADAASKGEAGQFAVGTLLEGLSLIPKIGSAGFDVWMSGLKDLEGAQQNSMKYYFNAGPKQNLRSVTVHGFDYNDAMQKFLFGGNSAKAFPMIRGAKMQAAQNADAKFRANKDIIPTKSNTASKTSLQAFPGVPSEI